MRIRGEYDLEKLRSTLERAKGGRSWRVYAMHAGISAGQLSKIVNGMFKPTTDTLYKLASEEAMPQGGVTYDELLQVAGYTEKITPEKEREIIEAYIESQIDSVQSGFLTINSKIKEEVTHEQEDKKNKQKAIVKQTEHLLQDQMLELGIKNGVLEVEARPFSATIQYNIQHPQFDSWIYLLLLDTAEEKYSTNAYGLFPRIYDQILLRILHMVPNKKKKISLVVYNKKAFNHIKKLKENNCFKAYLSVIYISTIGILYIEKEEELASYLDDEDHSMRLLKKN